MSDDHEPALRTRWLAPLLIGAFFAAVSLLMFAGAMGRNLNHDEHQFLVPGALLARNALHPFRDFPIFHLPNLVFVYSALDRLFDRPLFVARSFSALCATLSSVLIFHFCWNRTCSKPVQWRLAFAVGAALLLIFDPLFAYTTGRTWNHDLPSLLTVAAVLLHIGAAERNALCLAMCSALAAGLAAGTRLTYAPILIPLWLSIWAFPLPIRRRFALASAYIATATVALGPSLYYLITHREAFLFGNFEFPRLRLLDPENERIRKTMTISRKLRFFFKEVALPSHPLFLAYLLFSLYPAISWLRRRNGSLAAGVILAILPFALMGCFAPSRYQYQHFFVIVPLLVLGTVAGFTCPGAPRWQTRFGTYLALIFCVSSLSLGLSAYSVARNPFKPSEWFPYRIRKLGLEIANRAPTGKVLTLAPAYPIEGGSAVYPEFATGPFAWRSARFVKADRRSALRIVAPSDLSAFLESDPPGAILTGVEDKALELPFVEYAKDHHFRALKLDGNRTLWVPQPTDP